MELKKEKSTRLEKSVRAVLSVEAPGPPPDSLWAPLMVPEQGTQSQALGHIHVRAHLCEAEAKLRDPKRPAARAEATGETPHKRQSTPQPLSFLYCSYSSVSVPQSPTAQQQERSCSAGPGPHWPGWQPFPSPFSCSRRQETRVEEEEETVVSDKKASQCIQA